MPLTPEQKKDAISLNAEGFAHFQIGEKLGVDRKAVASYLQKQGLKSPYISSTKLRPPSNAWPTAVATIAASEIGELNCRS